MEDEKQKFMWFRVLDIMMVMAMIGSRSYGAICPSACRCENDILKTSCASAALEFVPIQLNPELHALDLSNNKIVHIHFSFPFYEKLVTLNISGNRIKTLGHSNFNSQRNLTVLDVSSNHIENLTKDSLKGLRALTHLDLSSNSLQEIRAVALRELHSLTVLRLSGNRLDHLEEGVFETSKNLRELYINDNQFLEVPTEALADALHLQLLYLSRNLIKSINKEEMPNLSELHVLLLDNNVISEIHPAGLSNLVSLNYLDLSDNNLTTMPTTALAKLSSLNMLRLSGNLITYIPPVAFRGLFHLKVLRIDRLEFLTTIDVRAFVDNINLENVHMDYNVKVKKIPTRLFHGNPKLKFISVRYNNIHILEATNFPLDQLHGLKVGGNPFQCNCTLGWLWQLIQEYKSKVARINTTTFTENYKFPTSLDLTLDENEITCSGPEGLNGELLSVASKRQMDCSAGWIAAVSVAITVIFILVVIGGVLYWAPKRKSRSNKKELSVDDVMTGALPSENISTKCEIFEPAPMEKYILQPPMITHNDYRSLHSWDPYAANTVNIYEQLNDNRERPHIVFV